MEVLNMSIKKNLIQSMELYGEMLSHCGGTIL